MAGPWTSPIGQSSENIIIKKNSAESILYTTNDVGKTPNKTGKRKKGGNVHNLKSSPFSLWECWGEKKLLKMCTFPSVFFCTLFFPQVMLHHGIRKKVHSQVSQRPAGVQ
jgi:hypothetical protein